MTQTQKTNGSHGSTAYIPYTTRQAAQVLGITITGVNDMIRRGTLTTTRFGTAARAHHFLNPADVHALAAQRAQVKAAREQEAAEKALRKAARTRPVEDPLNAPTPPVVVDTQMRVAIEQIAKMNAEVLAILQRLL